MAAAAVEATMMSTEAAILSQVLMLQLTLHPQHQAMDKTRMPNVSAPCETSFGLNGHTDTRIDGGYQNYVALWYQSLMYQQQQGGQGGAGAAPPGAQ